MEPWQSWAIAIAGGGLAYYYYVHKNKPKLGNKIRNTVEPISTSAKGSGRRDLALPSGDDLKPLGPSRKRKALREPRTPILDFPPASDGPDQDDDSNKAWAQQLAELRKGTTLSGPSGSGKSRQDPKQLRTVKQSATAVAAPLLNVSSSATSTDGLDSEDDGAHSPGAGNVTDMLEEPAPAGPSTIRLTASASSHYNKPARKQALFEPAETKKQRQNRKKVEERRLEREAAEQERRILLETQRRTAREARGEPARNGVVASKPPSTSPWAGKVTTGSQGVASNAPLLDTFDRTDLSSKPNGAVSEWQRRLPSEDAQMRLATKMSQDDLGWNTVSGKKKTRKLAAGSDGEGSEDIASQKSAPRRGEHTSVASKPAANTAYADLVEQDASLGAASHPDDSQWAA